MIGAFSKHQRGGALLEYAVALMILAAIFIVAAELLRTKASEHLDRSADVVEGFTPCTDPKYGGQLSSSECF